jgi:arginine deiminase
MGPARISSEVGRLRRVLVHEPGHEVDHMLPCMMEELLFDDILFGDAAREEHRRFRRVLEQLGVEVLDVQTLLAQALENKAARQWVLDPFHEALSRRLLARLQAADATTLADMLIHGVRQDATHAGTEVDDLFEIPPIPNLCFQRDPQIVIGNHVAIASMATPGRWRESLLAATVFRFHPQLSSVPVAVDPLVRGSGQPVLMGTRRPTFEGGDVLVLSSDVIAVGVSERTNRTGIRHLARALAGIEAAPRWMILVNLPTQRAFMHLDTIITPIDRDACLVYPPLVEADAPSAARAAEIDLHAREFTPHARGDFLGALRARGVDLKPIPCGGSDPVHQQREQWTDGANVLAVAPGVIVMYDRNVATAEALSAEGYRVVGSDDLLLGRTSVDPETGERVCILLPSHEISRARGGPHCLSHPLLRDDVT